MPCSQVQAVILDGDSDRASYQGGFYMGAHIVGAFEGMDEIGGTVGNQFIKECLEVMPYVRADSARAAEPEAQRGQRRASPL